MYKIKFFMKTHDCKQMLQMVIKILNLASTENEFILSSIYICSALHDIHPVLPYSIFLAYKTPEQILTSDKIAL